MTRDRDEELTEEEVARRRDEIVRRMIATPPQPKPAKVQKTDVKDKTEKRGQE